MEEVASEAVLNQAYAWLCQRRRTFPSDADVWALCRHWQRDRPQLRAALLGGTYRFAVLSRVTLTSGEEIDLWSARDALVLKSLALVLARRLPLSPRCAHLKGHGGSKGTLREALSHLDDNRFVLRTDIRFYYASIEHDLLLDRLAGCIQGRRVLNLMAQYLKHCAECSGPFWDYQTGVALGCSLSPLIGAFFLRDLDLALERLGLFFIRFMDDVLVLAPARWKLRHAVQVLNRTLAALHLEKHPAKTFIGWIDKGFEFWAITWPRAGSPWPRAPWWRSWSVPTGFMSTSRAVVPSGSPHGGARWGLCLLPSSSGALLLVPVTRRMTFWLRTDRQNTRYCRVPIPTAHPCTCRTRIPANALVRLPGGPWPWTHQGNHRY